MKDLFSTIELETTDHEWQVDTHKSNLNAKPVVRPQITANVSSDESNSEEFDDIPDIEATSKKRTLIIRASGEYPASFSCKIKLKDAQRRKIYLATKKGINSAEFDRNTNGKKQWLLPNKQFTANGSVLSTFTAKNGVVVSNIELVY